MELLLFLYVVLIHELLAQCVEGLRAAQFIRDKTLIFLKTAVIIRKIIIDWVVG